MKPARVPFELLALAAVALLVRGLGVAQVFPGDGWVELETGDSAYHARRALWSFVNFPRVLVFDAYMAHPGGAVVPMPPLYDWALAGLARTLGDGVDVFERVAAWFAPGLAALTVLPVYVAGRVVASHGVGLVAAALFAVLPASARMSSVGDVDHHAAVTLLGAAWLASSASCLRPGSERLWRASAALTLVRAAMLLSWSGSLLYVVLGEGALLLGGLLDGRARLLWAQAVGCAAAALLVTPWLLFLEASAAPGFAATNLSWLHVVALLAVASTAAGVALLARAEPRASRRLALAAGIGLVLLALLLLYSPIADALGSGLSFLTKSDSWGRRNLEQQPLSFAWRAERGGLPVARDYYGLLAYALPFALLAVLARLRASGWRGPALVLACWTGVLGWLSLQQVRFGSDFAPAAALALALLLAGAHAALRSRLPQTAALAALASVCGLLLWPGFASSYGAKLARLRAWLEHGAELPPGRLASGVSLARFARTVGEVTPETSGYLDDGAPPEYAVLCRPSHGHTLHYMARRATPANNFGPYLHRDRYLAAELFYSVPGEPQALALAEGTGSRYVLTFAQEAPSLERFADRLHHWDGGGPAPAPASRRFRLVAEGPPDGTPRHTAFPSGRVPRGTIPYKLFEVVAGAVLQVRGEPGKEVRAELWLTTPLGRRFRYRAVARANAQGVARLRVPYASEPATSVVADGPYRVFAAGAVLTAPVPEHAVRRGEVVVVGRSGSSAGSASR